MMARGELERQVMVLLWRAGEPLTVADVQGLLIRDRDLAYTTVMTVLDRLAKKGLARRERRGRAWYYEPADPQSVVLAREMAGLLRDVPAEVRDEALRLLSESLSLPSPTP
ncbi:BlaI/MecI/CopY family transcriptional regulator [Arachnia propionica]|uniref:BlaI/MecI/CopY family transcriptional regulator n=1 Tax=Arachnia propionica TaxID=1750 RepID=UPI0028E83314|nr:BlaI/MecI/CopY family transcriptional regulator [Arachnia propionica]